MSKANRNPSTLRDRRVLEAVRAARAAAEEYRVARREMKRLYYEAECHPDMPAPPASPKEADAVKRATEKVWHQVGYDVASKAFNRCGKAYGKALNRAFRLSPVTRRGVIEKLDLWATTDPEIVDDFLRGKDPLRQIVTEFKRIEGRDA